MGFDAKLIQWLLSNSSGLTTEGRFLLLCLVYEYNESNNDVDISINRLVDVYGVTKTVCSQLTTFLSLPENKIGRIRRSKSRVCEFDSVALSRLMLDDDGFEQGDLHQQIIIDLLTNYMQKAKCNDGGNGGHLRVSNLLLLIILLIHADKAGSVKDLSKAQIRKLMGCISVDRLNSQLKTVTSKGYILANSRGGTGSNIFGKVSNNYLLDLGHLQELECCTNEEIKDYEVFFLNKITTGILDIIDIDRRSKQQNASSDVGFKMINDMYHVKIKIYMDLFINKNESIVALLLTEHWDDIETLDINQCNFLDFSICQTLLTGSALFSVSYMKQNSKNQCKNEVIVTNQSFQQWLRGIYDNDLLTLQAHQLTEFLLEQSLKIAKWIKELLADSDKPDHIGIALDQRRISASLTNTYALSVCLAGVNRYDVYSISAKSNTHNPLKWIYTINVKKYSKGANVRVI